MGAGASTNGTPLSELEKAKIAELKAMSPEAQQALAAAAMRDVLAASIQFAVAEGQKGATWAAVSEGGADNPFAVPVPYSGDFSAIAQLAGKVPMVGSTLAGAIMKPVSSVAASFADCAKTVCAQEATLSALLAVAAGITTETAIALGTRAGGSSYAEYLIKTAQLPMLKLWRPLSRGAANARPDQRLGRLHPGLQRSGQKDPGKCHQGSGHL